MKELMTELMTDYLYIVIAAGMVLLALLILIIVLVKSRKNKRQKTGPGGDQYYENALSSISSGGRAPVSARSFDEKLRSGSGNQPLPDRVYGAELVPRGETAYSSSLEKTVDEFSYDQEKTIDEFSMLDNEKTVDALPQGVRVSFRISFGGRTQTADRMITDRLVLGRGSQANLDVVFGMKNDDAKQTSREHAVITYRPDGLYVEDNHSRNGTSLNGKALTSAALLRNEDVLQMGKAIVQVRIDRVSM